MIADSVEPEEDRTVRYLELATEAIKAAAMAKTRETREGYLAIAASWMELAKGTRRGTERG